MAIEAIDDEIASLDLVKAKMIVEGMMGIISIYMETPSSVLKAMITLEYYGSPKWPQLKAAMDFMDKTAALAKEK